MHSVQLLTLSLLALSLSVTASRLEARQSTDTATTDTATSAATTSTQSGIDSTVVGEACYPTNSTGGVNPNAPCAQVAVLTDICAFGNSSSDDSNPSELSPVNQQKCFCGGPFWQYLDG